MSGYSPSAVKSEPNLTPILDMVFQLITFFMLVINFKSAELDLTLNLPIVGSAKPVPSGSEESPLVLNIRNVQGKANLALYGRLIPEDQIPGYLAAEAHASMMAARCTPNDLGNDGRGLPDVVVIRADERCPFRIVNYIMRICKDEGYRRFAMRSVRTSART